MKKIRIVLAASLFCAALLMVVGQLAHAAPPRTLTPGQEKAARKCDNKLADCWSFCAGSMSPTVRDKCDTNCIDKWKSCLRNSGVPWIERQMPKRPVTSMPGTKPPVEREPATPPKRRPSETGQKAGQATKSGGTSPTPAAKASP